ncbi:MAG: DNA polymerase III subunit beta, partial [Clostridiales bacterium]|nr:DNA polymerase III subunit beta [Clostridiales bacterium]
MVIRCGKQNLQDALALAGRAVSTRTTNPILECVLLTAVEGVGVTLIGNDKEICIETAAIPAEIDISGSMALDAKLFTEIIRKMPGESVVIEIDEKYNAICKSERSRLQISGQSAEEFPIIPENELEGKERYKIKASIFKSMIKQTIFSVAVDHTKPILTGEKMEIKNNVLEMIAIDMFRISYASVEMENAADTSAVVPGRALGELSRALPDTDEEVSFFFTQNRAVFETEGFRMVSSLLAGEFIRHDQIYNEDFSTMVVVDRVKLLNTFERAVLVAQENRMLPVKLEVGDDDITIFAKSERGIVDDGVPCETEGKDLTIYFNPKYFIDVLRALEEERVVIKFNNVLSPCSIRGPENERGCRYLI